MNSIRWIYGENFLKILSEVGTFYGQLNQQTNARERSILMTPKPSLPPDFKTDYWICTTVVSCLKSRIREEDCSSGCCSSWNKLKAIAESRRSGIKTCSKSEKI